MPKYRKEPPRSFQYLGGYPPSHAHSHPPGFHVRQTLLGACRLPRRGAMQ